MGLALRGTSTADTAVPRRRLFLLRFLTFWALGVSVVALLPEIEELATRGTVASLASACRLFGLHVSVTGPVIAIGPAAIAIIPDCTPIGPALALWAAMLAYPARWGRRAFGMSASLPALWAFNLVRVGSLLGILVAKPSAYDAVHSFLWQPATLLAVLGAFAFWVRVLPQDGGA